MRAKIIAVHHVPFVTNNDGPSLAVRQSPVDNIFTKWSTGGLDVTVTITRDIAILAAIVDVDHPSRSLDSRFFPVEPAELFHDNSFWSRTRLRFLADWSVSSPMDLGKTLALATQRLIYINNRTRCQAWPYEDRGKTRSFSPKSYLSKGVSTARLSWCII